MSVQDLCAVVGAVTGVLSFIWTIFQQNEIKRIKNQSYLKNSGFVEKNSKAGGDIAGRDIKK
ncbi:hypothetical protein [Lactococcus petauri]|uniref:Uncharacterized protein n=1 Tax=Lactococcus petauri TaxID=1940789 RepID=A0A252CC89_9LACT|nr:hypothetical protein [Lactococcus petauri]OUK04186.1 hypothetical protein BZZ03_06835 [Lactococcus petauri]